MDTRNKLFAAVGAVAIVAAAAIGVVKIIGTESGGEAVSTQSKTTSASSITPSTASSTAAGPVATSGGATTAYRDGEYTANAGYRVPHGSNTISVTLTIKDGKVAAVTTKDDYTDSESAYYIDSFASEIKGVVVGEPLDGLRLSRVGGASLTTEGFNQAMATITSAAKG